jgi:hypothetical protein
MFEKRKQVETPFDEGSLELLPKEKVKYATKVYIKSFGRLLRINTLGVVSEIEGNEFVTTYTAQELADMFYENKIKFYRDKKDVD